MMLSSVSLRHFVAQRDAGQQKWSGLQLAAGYVFRASARGSLSAIGAHTLDALSCSPVPAAGGVSTLLCCADKLCLSLPSF